MGLEIRFPGFALAIQLLVAFAFLTIQTSHGFSIQVPASRLAGLGFERGIDDVPTSKRYRQDIPLSALLQRSELGRNNVFKRDGPNSAKPATCTCTCETKPADTPGSAYKRVHSTRGQRSRGPSSSPYEFGARAYGERQAHSPVKKFHKVHHETPATCTCTCETHPNDELTLTGPNHGSNSQPSGSKSHQKQDSIFWNDGDDYWGQGENQQNLWGEKPQTAALTSEQHQGKSQGQESEENNDGVWGHESRYPWKNLPDTICYREQCERDSECCMRFNLCDRSAKVCVDCWYGASCEDESNCCYKYPICKTETFPAHNGVPGAVVVSGKCVDKL